MTKEQYFELCEQLGTQPKDEEIPLELGEFPIEIQQIFLLYENLEDRISEFNGVFIGKVRSGFPYFYGLYCQGIDEKFCITILNLIENISVDLAIKKHKAASSRVELAKV